MVETVEYAHAQGSETDKEDVGENDAVEGDGLIPTRGNVGGGERSNHITGENDTQDGDQRKNQSNSPEKLVGEVPKLLGAAFSHVGGKDGNDGGGDRALPNQAPEKIGDTIGKDERIGAEGGAEQESNTLVTEIAEDAADNRNQGDNRSRLQNLVFLGQKAALRTLNPIKTVT